MSEIRQFYAGRNIFITGGTGFLGKALVEKLLRSCEEIGTVYLLIRGKKGKTTQERMDSLLLEPVFDVLRTSSPDFSKKLVPVAGDVASEGLGLSAEDRERIVDEVSVIFHAAATVRFTERLDKAIPLNVNGVKYVLDIAKACKNLAVGVHLSTAFSNCVLSSIDEKLYVPPLSYREANDLCESLKNTEMSEGDMESFTKSVLKGWPNTYTFTKAIGEGVVAEFAGELPFAVFRPSIVINSYEEPMPGWISGIAGFPAITCASGLGLNHIGFYDSDAKMDLVPVDYVCNALISSAWETAVTKKRHHENIPVYNYVGGNEKPITCGQCIGDCMRYHHENPSVQLIYYPFMVITTSRFVLSLLQFFLHTVPAFVIDGVARLLGKQPRIVHYFRMQKLATMLGNAWITIGYFLTKEWDFETHRVRSLWQRIGPTDKKEFPFSMQEVDWEKYCIRIVGGLKKYVANDPPGNEDKAKRRYIYFYIVHSMVRLALYSFALWLVWKIFW
ncbi:fatty acyl-CoA reductase wat-like isoform X1 [Neodiprion virginianus]|uniref:fatty acyl-CoA reductase wat-like isoform X1 n=1 Tax=Neodiprion virginianus TaxID=2961670 RepID=UPI001EE72913|nr:fatty acyl-CoA reductase wat-like isoform X1 [Neodiprion virginianus]